MPDGDAPVTPPIFDGTTPRPVPSVDLGLDDIEPATEHSTPLDAVIEELTALISDVERIIAIPARPGWALVVNIDFPYDDLKLWRKRAITKAAKGDKPAEVDEMRVACTVIAARTVGLLRRGEPIVAGGEPATFGNDAFLSSLGNPRAIDAVRSVFGMDGHVLRAGYKIVDEAGYGDDMPEPADDDLGLGADPTSRGSRTFSD